ncbi:ATP-binding protein [Pseudonocardia sp. RS010]|uniref:ATP-binding protein n=1 Tax=Pseudonocardia sp. RS010 TaxID=3385979 RepID=UPI0039A21C3F
MPALGCDDADAPAPALFHAAAERLGAVVPARDEPTVRWICRDLDGLPLAIELAAAQLRVLTPADIARRLDRRFALLRDRRGPGRDRHASLSSVLESTLALLDEGERELLGLLAAFPATFSLVDVEEVAGDAAGAGVAAALARLVDHSLVAPTDGDRFRLLESVRLFAAGLADAERHRARHAEWCRDRVGRDLRRHLYDWDAAAWCTAHYDDLGAAERRLLERGRTDDAAWLVAGVALAMHSDTGARAAAVLPRVEDHAGRQEDPALVARLHLTGVHAGMAARSPAAIADHGERALRAAREAGDPVLHAAALVLRSWSTVFTDRDTALAQVEEAAGLAERAGDTVTRNLADSYRAFHLAVLHRYDEAVAQAAEVTARSPDPAGYDTYVAAMAQTACWAVPDPQRARRFLGHVLSRPSPDDPAWGSLLVAAAVHAAADEPAQALALVETARSRLHRAGRDGLPDLLVPAAVLAHRRGEQARAARWLRAVRRAGRPTQSFQVTVVYRRLRDAVDAAVDATADPDADPPAATDPARLPETGDEALSWMRALTRPAVRSGGRPGGR